MDNKIEINISTISKEFVESRKNNFRSLSRKKAHRKIDSKLYKLIIIKFLTIYFYDVYFFNKPMYFLFGGKIKLCKTKRTIFPNKNSKDSKFKLGQLKEFKPKVSLFWYNRMLPIFYYRMKLKKLTGSTNRLPIIEKEWLEKNDVNLLDTNDVLVKKGFSMYNEKQQ